MAIKSTIYDSARRRSAALEELNGVIQYRDLIYQLVRRDIVSRYKRSVLGIAWTMIQPLGLMIVFTLVFSNLFHHVISYPSYILSGLIAWTFFSQTTTASIHQIVWGRALMNKIYLPRTVFAISAIGTGLVNFILSLAPLIMIMLITGIPLHWSALLVPIAIIMLTAFALGIGLLLSTLAVYFPDVAEMYQIVLIMWMYLTPIIYPESILPDKYRDVITTFNPMYYLVRIFRATLYEGVFPQWNVWITGTFISLVSLIVGWYFFSKKADEFPYHA